MNVSEKIRAMLDEREVCYFTIDGKHEKTVWDVGGVIWWYDVDTETGETVLFTPSEGNITPEQAIAATLGSGTCKLDGDVEYVDCGVCKFYHTDIQLCEYGIPPCSKFERKEMGE